MGSVNVRRLLPVLMTLAAAGCSFDASTSAPSRPESTSSNEASAGENQAQQPFVRACESSVYGKLQTRARRRHSIVAGPVIFYFARSYASAPTSSFDPAGGRRGRYWAQKLLVVVRAGAVARVVVPRAEQRHAALLYDPAAWTNEEGAYRISDGQTAVAFEACAENRASPLGGPVGAPTQFNGGFVVAGARCLPLLVSTEQRTIRTTLSFGAGRCGQV